MIIIFTDGSSLGNPGEGGWGAIVACEGRVTELGGKESRTTNNRMEMKATVGALSFIHDKFDEITVYSDSQYMMNGITKWIGGWKANGWKTKNKTDVLNKDLWQELDSLIQNKTIVWKYVEGHVGIPGNERVDEIATSFASGKTPPLYLGREEDYRIDVSQVDAVKSLKNKKEGVSQKAYSYLSLLDGKLEKHKTWAETETRVKGKKGARFRKTLSKEHEEEVIKEWLGK